MFENTKIVYSEPQQYLADINTPLSFGIKKVGIIPTFKGRYNPQEELKLILFLGYEGDRALALLENIEPHKTIFVIPKPAFYPEWEGVTEELNRAILSLAERSSIFYSHSQDPNSTYDLLKKIIDPLDSDNIDNWYIAPLGTKLQAIGVYYFVSEYPEIASVIYGTPIKHNEKSFSEGIGKTFEVAKRKN